MSKKLLALGLLALMLISTACGQPARATQSPSGNAAGDASSEYRIQLYVEATNVPSSEGTVIGDIIKEKFNIIFDYEVMVGDWNEFVNRQLASRDFPEICYLRWDFVGTTWVNGGGAIPLDDLFADKENFHYLHAPRLPLWKMDDPTGEDILYKWTLAGGLSEAMGPRGDMTVRADVLEHYGYPKLLSQTSWVEFMDQAVKDFPTDLAGNKTIGMTLCLAETWAPNLTMIFVEKGTYTGAVLAPVVFNFAKREFEDFLAVPCVKENYQFFNELYRRELLDAECFTTTTGIIVEKMNTAQPITNFYFGGGANGNLINSGNEEYIYVSLPIQSDSQVANKETRYLATWQGYGTYAYTMTPATKDPERLASLMDWACSPEGLSLITWGIEGTHYEWLNGIKTPTQEFIDMYMERSDEYYKQGVGGFAHLSHPAGYNPYDNAAVNFGSAPVFTEMTYTPTRIKYLDAYGFKREEEFWTKGTYFPTTMDNITVEQSVIIMPAESEEARRREQILQTRDNFIADLIRASSPAEFERIWDTYVAAHNAFDPMANVDFVNSRYAEMMARYEAAMK